MGSRWSRIVAQIHLGVTDIPYSWGQKAAGGISAAKAMQAARRVDKGGAPPAVSPGNVTTYQVAAWLEQRYKLLQTFLALRERQIGADIETSLDRSMEIVAMGGPVRPFASAISLIEDRFKNDLSLRAFDGVIPGVPTHAAQMGWSHRFKYPYRRRPPRPSFIDTGLLQSSFRVWTS